MEYRRLGRSGLKVSPLCLGTMQLGWTADEETSLEVLTAAFEAGIQFIDTADVYSRWAEGNPGGVSERIIGKWLGMGVANREEVVIATKVRAAMGEGPNDEGLSRLHIIAAAQDSLRRLGTDYIDLYQLHSPDEGTPIEETLSALDFLVRRGDVRYIGCSNFPAWRLVQALWRSDANAYARFISLQPHYSLVHRQEYERELEAVCLEFGLGVLPYSPLAGGFLTGKYERGKEIPGGTRAASSKRIQGYMQEECNWALLERLRELGEARGKSPSQMALAWLLNRPSITSPIIGPKTPEQLADNLGAVGVKLEGDEFAAIAQITTWEEA
jgi:aryl-alcohol dehydrogenase-like predicted oxidoreductase